MNAPERTIPERRLWLLTGGAGLVMALVLTAVSLYWGDLNQDEGWYLYGARMVAEGRRPYLDFASTQGPVMSYVYALADPLVRAWGLAGGRAFTALLGILGWGAAAWLAWRLAPPAFPGGDRTGESRVSNGLRAAVLALVLIGVNVFQAYYGTIVKTYSLAGLALLLGFVALTYVRGPRPVLAATLAGAALALAAGTRISAILAPAVVALWWWRAPGGRTGLMAFLVGGLATGLAVFLPFFIVAPEQTWFGVVAYHAGREAGGLAAGLAYKVGFFARVSLAYAVAVALALTLLGLRVFQGPVRGAAHPVTVPLGLAVLAITGVHALAPFPYDDYQAMIYPLFAVAVAVALLRRVQGPWLAPVLAAVCALMALGSPLPQGWFVGPRDRIWWPLKTRAPLAVLQDTAARLRAHPAFQADAPLLTQDPYLAVEAGLRLPEGLELGQFSYYPDWDTARARRCRVLNRAGFEALLDTCPAPLAAFSGYGFAIRSPEVRPLPAAEQQAWWDRLERRYAPWATVAPFGQADTELRLYQLKSAP